MKILILGASGFIGQNCYKILSNKYNCVGTRYSKQDNRFIYANLCNITDVNNIIHNEKPDIIIHAAAVTSGAKDILSCPYIHVTDNVVMSSLIFRAAFEYNVPHVIFLSCSIMYQSKEEPQSENDWNIADPLIPAYTGAGYTKIYLEQMCKFFASFQRNKYTVIRHTNIYGPYDKFDLQKSHFIGATINKVINAKSDINIWGNGKAKRDVLYISDLVDLIDKCIEKQSTNYELINCAYGKAYSILDLTKKIIKYSKSNINYDCDISKPDIPISITLNCDRAQKLFGWTPKIRLSQGIEKTVEWYLNYENKY